MESNIICLIRLDAWIMTILEFVRHGENRRGNRQKHYLYSSHKLPPVGIGQIIASLYKCLE